MQCPPRASAFFPALTICDFPWAPFLTYYNIAPILLSFVESDVFLDFPVHTNPDLSICMSPYASPLRVYSFSKWNDFLYPSLVIHFMLLIFCKSLQGAYLLPSVFLDEDIIFLL